MGHVSKAKLDVQRVAPGETEGAHFLGHGVQHDAQVRRSCSRAVRHMIDACLDLACPSSNHTSVQAAAASRHRGVLTPTRRARLVAMARARVRCGFLVVNVDHHGAARVSLAVRLAALNVAELLRGLVLQREVHGSVVRHWRDGIGALHEGHTLMQMDLPVEKRAVQSQRLILSALTARVTAILLPKTKQQWLHLSERAAQMGRREAQRRHLHQHRDQP
mmetsp:Transcript_6656/g.24681  ORF Transcript_6656/g.24681 Transcript_6656/m.24681 type:complete len:219 (+) Transcript_6656:1120-1776(+)